MSFIKKFWNALNTPLVPLRGFNYASGPYPMYVTGEVGRKEPKYLEEGSNTYLEEGFKGTATIYSIITQQAGMIRAIPWKVQMSTKGGKIKDVPEHELYDSLLYKANAWMPFKDFIEQVAGFLLLHGEALTFANIVGKRTEEWLPLSPPHMVLNPGDKFEPIESWSVVGYPTVKYAPEQILHAKMLNLEYAGHAASQTRGMSPLRASLLPLQENTEAVRSSIKSFINQGPGGIIHKEKGTNEESPMTEGQAKKLQEKMEMENMGSDNARKILFTNAVLNYKQVGLSPVDLNILQQRTFTRAELCNPYHWPVELLNDNSHSTYNNLSEMHLAAYLHAIIPNLDKISESLNVDIARMYGRKTWITPDLSTVEVLQLKRQQMAEWLGKAWWIKVSRKQELMGEEMDPLMDYYADPNGQPLETPEEARTRRAAASVIEEDPEDENGEEAARQSRIRIAKEFNLEEFKQNGNGSF